MFRVVLQSRLKSPLKDNDIVVCVPLSLLLLPLLASDWNSSF